MHKILILLYPIVSENPKDRKSVYIDKKSLNWIKEQIDRGEFENRSAGIRKCILITRRVYETAEPEEIVKFIHGQNHEKSRD